MASAAAISVPKSIRPEVSNVTCAWIGSRRPVSRKARPAPATSAFSSRMSNWVSMMTTSAPASIPARTCRRAPSASSSHSEGKSGDPSGPRVRATSDASSPEGSAPDGPMATATKRGRSGVDHRSAARRAHATALKLISYARSAKPHSCRRRKLPWKVSVSSTSAPASRYASWISSRMSGRVVPNISCGPRCGFPR